MPEPRPVGRSLRGVGLIRGPPRWPNLARHFPTGWTLVSDKTGLSSERRDPHDLLHGCAAAWAGDCTSTSRKVRHNIASTRVLSHLASIRTDPSVSLRILPMAMPIKHVGLPCPYCGKP